MLFGGRRSKERGSKERSRSWSYQYRPRLPESVGDPRPDSAERGPLTAPLVRSPALNIAAPDARVRRLLHGKELPWNALTAAVALAGVVCGLFVGSANYWRSQRAAVGHSASPPVASAPRIIYLHAPAAVAQRPAGPVAPARLPRTSRAHRSRLHLPVARTIVHVGKTRVSVRYGRPSVRVRNRFFQEAPPPRLRPEPPNYPGDGPPRFRRSGDDWTGPLE